MPIPRNRFIRFVPGDQPTPDATEIIRGDVYLGVFIDAAFPERKIKMPMVVAAPVQPATKSTINWVSITAPMVSLAAWLGLNIDPEMLVQLIIGLQAAVGLYVVVKGTWFSPRVLAPSAATLPLA